MHDCRPKIIPTIERLFAIEIADRSIIGEHVEFAIDFCFRHVAVGFLEWHSLWRPTEKFDRYKKKLN